MKIATSLFLLASTIFSTADAEDLDKRRTEVQVEQLMGTWELVSFDLVLPLGIKFPWGKNSRGALSYSSDGQMHASVTSEPSHFPYISSFYKDHFEYSGNFELKDDLVLHHVKQAVPSSWINATLRRKIKEIKDNKITLTGDAPVGSFEIVWKKV